jgi:hypothetical protein
MTFGLIEGLAILSLCSLLFNTLQQQKIKSMKISINYLEDEIEDKILIIRALTVHVEPSDNQVDLIKIDVDSDAEPVFGNLTEFSVLNYVISNNLKPENEEKFIVNWYFPSKYVFENTPPDLSIQPWCKTFTIDLNT